jgi:hypothetical protein
MTFYGQNLDRLAGQFTHTHELGPETRKLISELVDKILATVQRPTYEQPPVETRELR